MTKFENNYYGQMDVNLMLSIHSNDVQTATNLLKIYNADPDTIFCIAMNEVPAVMLCLERGLYDMAKVFINAGCSVNRITKNGQSCLHVAVQKQHIELVDLLIKKRANVNSIDSDGQTPLHFACYGTSLEIVKLLVENGANINQKSYCGRTPLMFACSMNRLEIVKYLLSTKKCNINDVDDKNISSLIYATNSSSLQLKPDMIEYLIKNGANVNHFDLKGSTALNTLLPQCSESNLTGYDLVSTLINYGCDLEFKGSNNLTPVHLSIFHDQDSITELLIRSGCNLNSLNYNNQTVLFSLIKNQKTELIKIAVNAGADLNYFEKNLKECLRISLLDLLSRLTDKELKNYLIDLFSKNNKIKSLKNLSKLKIRNHLGRFADQNISLLNLPVKLKKYLLLEES